jgi:hypothetical protein
MSLHLNTPVRPTNRQTSGFSGIAASPKRVIGLNHVREPQQVPGQQNTVRPIGGNHVNQPPGDLVEAVKIGKGKNARGV